ncbi:MAG TPA: HprK-related kinase A [Woeseiaceae bacterium]|nr:HprK-related kinase A [Woeseiaceae bacterium]
MTANSTGAARVGDLSEQHFGQRLHDGIGVQIGPFAARIVVRSERIVESLYRLYRDYALLPDDTVFSFHVRLDERRGVPGLRAPRVRFSVDGRAPHEDMPAEQALAVLEWGINLVIALRSHAFLMLHSAIAEFRGHAMLLPAAPGAGKTTLCAGLSLSGWRLFSDEFGLMRPGTPDMLPVPRPLALKNESISVIRGFSANANLGPEIPGTRKGTVAHLRPPGDSILRSEDAAPVRWLVFPEWRPDTPCALIELPKQEGFMHLATNAFNYELLGESGYNAVATLIGTASCHRFVYSDLNEAVALLTDFANDDT